MALVDIEIAETRGGVGEFGYHDPPSPRSLAYVPIGGTNKLYIFLFSNFKKIYKKNHRKILYPPLTEIHDVTSIHVISATISYLMQIPPLLNPQWFARGCKKYDFYQGKVCNQDRDKSSPQPPKNALVFFSMYLRPTRSCRFSVQFVTPSS